MHSIILGLLAAVLTYLFLKYKHDNEPDNERKPINYYIPCVVGLVIWFGVSCYFDHKHKRATLSYSSESASFHIINKDNIKLPTSDVFIDLAKF